MFLKDDKKRPLFLVVGVLLKSRSLVAFFFLLGGVSLERFLQKNLSLSFPCFVFRVYSLGFIGDEKTSLIFIEEGTPLPFFFTETLLE